MHPADWYTERNIKLLLDTVATRVDPQKQTVQLHDGSELAYDTLILANGASPFVPPIKGVELDGVKHCALLKTRTPSSQQANTLQRWSVSAAAYSALKLPAR